MDGRNKRGRNEWRREQRSERERGQVQVESEKVAFGLLSSLLFSRHTEQTTAAALSFVQGLLIALDAVKLARTTTTTMRDEV